MEKAVNENLLELAKKADVQGDFHLLNFLDEFIKDQVVKSLMSDVVEIVLLVLDDLRQPQPDLALVD